MRALSKSLRRYDGELEINHQMSPGTQAVPEGAVQRNATYTCSHCQAVCVKGKQWVSENHYCPKCDHHICAGCMIRSKTDLTHRPFIALIEGVGAGKEIILTDL